MRNEAQAVRATLGRTGPFGLGLRLGARAATQLKEPGTLAAFQSFLADAGLYVFTVNGFPYGPFHGTQVKESVYAPDWSTPERLAYTRDLVYILARLLPAGVPGSISTVPGSYRRWVDNDPYRDRILSGLGHAARACDAARRETGRHIRLAIEPEPDCIWDTTADIIDLFRAEIPNRAAPLLAADTGVPVDTCRRMLLDHLGVCVDTCHQAVLFENVAGVLQTLVDAGIPLAKVQISAALSCRPSRTALTHLREFADPVYLHQTALRDSAGTVRRFPDLEEAVEAAARTADPANAELRTHFHIPLSRGGYGELESTRFTLDDAFFNLLRERCAPNLEVETYTFSVLPEQWQKQGVVASIASELKWVIDRF